MSKAICKICGKGFGAITHNHLKTHNLTMKENTKTGFVPKVKKKHKALYIRKY